MTALLCIIVLGAVGFLIVKSIQNDTTAVSKATNSLCTDKIIDLQLHRIENYVSQVNDKIKKKNDQPILEIERNNEELKSKCPRCKSKQIINNVRNGIIYVCKKCKNEWTLQDICLSFYKTTRDVIRDAVIFSCSEHRQWLIDNNIYKETVNRVIRYIGDHNLTFLKSIKD